MTDTPNLTLPEIAANQAQKHVTHNEALRILDAVTQAAVIDRDLTAPPAVSAEGDRYLVAANATGDWLSQDNNLAVWDGVSWAFYMPKEGWLVWVADEDVLLAWTGSAWATAGGGGGGAGNFTSLGINGTADNNNRLLVQSNQALFNHAPGGNGNFTLTFNKGAADDDAGMIFQTGFSSRAFIGSFGSDNFTLKVSPNGSTFHDAWVINAANGQTAFEQGEIQLLKTDRGSTLIHKTHEEALALSGSSDDSTFVVPADARLLGISVRVLQTVALVNGLGASFRMGVKEPGVNTKFTGEFSGTVSGSAGSTRVYIPEEFYYGAFFRITRENGSDPNFAGGEIRLTFHYLEISATTS